MRSCVKVRHHLGGSSASIAMCAASGSIKRSCSSSPVVSSMSTGARARLKRDELARESRKDRKSRVLERVVGEVDDEAIAVVTLNVDGIRLIVQARMPDVACPGMV